MRLLSATLKVFRQKTCSFACNTLMCKWDKVILDESRYGYRDYKPNSRLSPGRHSHSKVRLEERRHKNSTELQQQQDNKLTKIMIHHLGVTQVASDGDTMRTFGLGTMPLQMRSTLTEQQQNEVNSMYATVCSVAMHNMLIGTKRKTC